MKLNWKKLLLCLAIPLAVGGLSALLSGSGLKAFAQMEQPPLSPPGWLFPVVWTILYLMMGLASYLVVESGMPKAARVYALRPYVLQLIFNFFWSILFFRLELYYTAFVWLLALWVLILVTILRFCKIDKRAAYLLIPYLVWVTFAGYLNLGVAILN